MLIVLMSITLNLESQAQETPQSEPANNPSEQPAPDQQSSSRQAEAQQAQIAAQEAAKRAHDAEMAARKAQARALQLAVGQMSPEQLQEARTQSAAILNSSTLATKYKLLQTVRCTPAGQKQQGLVATHIGTVYAQDVVTAAAAQDIYEPFGAVFDVLGSFSDAGSGAYPSAQSGIQTQALGRIDWESQHYRHDCKNGDTNTFQDKKVDFSFGGSIGLYPALVLENLSSTTTTIAQPNARPMFQNAFNWQIGPRVNYPFFSHGEASFFMNFGQNFLIDQVTSFKQGDNTVTATPVSNGVGRSAAFAEAGLEAKILPTTFWQAHDNKYDVLRPVFSIAAGVKKDTRLSRSGDLSTYDHPQDRVFFRFFLNLTSIADSLLATDDAKKAKPASVRFGIDLDRGLYNQRIPTATRFFVSADFNIMKVFKPSSDQPKQ